MYHYPMRLWFVRTRVLSHRHCREMARGQGDGMEILRRYYDVIGRIGITSDFVLLEVKMPDRYDEGERKIFL